MTDTTTTKPPFGVDHVKTVTADILTPPRVAKKNLRWAFRLNHTDFRSRDDFRWPFPGFWGEASGPFTTTDNLCPSAPGDGLCVAHTLGGASSGGNRVGGSVGLLVCYLDADLLASSAGKSRVRRAWVAGVFDPVRAVVAAKDGANLGGANLEYADLRGANLQAAELRYANLQAANLRDANLRDANYTQQTLWPARYDPKANGATEVQA